MISAKSPAPCLAVFGTGSDVGKSIVVTALCRIFSNRGIRVAPYKTQNMSNNSGVTPEGLEMGRAQIVQAEAGRTPPHVDMNPILLKPTSDIGSQVVLLGKAVANRTACEYHEQKELLFSTACLPPECQDRIAGFVINRFCGDISLFQDGTRWIESRSGKPVFGVLPWVDNLGVAAEDSVVIENPKKPVLENDSRPAIAIIRIPHISNFTDFDPLTRISGISVSFLEQPQDLSPFKAVIIPGSKNTCFDLKWLHRTGWSAILKTYAAGGRHVLGICGGYQMLGTRVHDPSGLEGHPGSTDGLDMLPVETTLKAPKTTTLSTFEWNGVAGKGYEIHMGQTRLFGENPLLTITERNGQTCNEADGARAGDFSVMGTYIHGLFDTPGITRIWLDQIGLYDVAVSVDQGPVERDLAYDRLAIHFESHVNFETILSTLKVATGDERGENSIDS
jgi:adenosylcobyric acid synthase